MRESKKRGSGMGGRKARASQKADGKRRWVAEVKTDSTHPPAGLFTKNAATIAKALASKKVSPKGPGSGMRMLSYYINRAGRGLTARRRAELERAKTLLSPAVRKAKDKRSPVD
jgi:tRNA(adenine34) deaminase